MIDFRWFRVAIPHVIVAGRYVSIFEVFQRYFTDGGYAAGIVIGQIGRRAVFLIARQISMGDGRYDITSHWKVSILFLLWEWADIHDTRFDCWHRASPTEPFVREP